jgi:hypothetical protein
LKKTFEIGRALKNEKKSDQQIKEKEGKDEQ